MRTGSMSTVRLVSASSEKMLDDIAFTARVSNEYPPYLKEG